MSVHYQATGFVFKKEDRGEADRIFSIFTKEYGLLEISGRAMRKIASKLRGGMELFQVCDIEFVQGKHKKTLTDATVLQKFRSIQGSPEKMEIATGICLLVEHFIKGQERDERIFDLLADTFLKLQTAPARQLIYFYFFWNFVSLLGYSPDLSAMPAEAASLINSLIRKEWDTVAMMHIEKERQESFKKISQQYYHYLLTHTR